MELWERTSRTAHSGEKLITIWEMSDWTCKHCGQKNPYVSLVCLWLGCHKPKES